jgi:hypothetical protein
LPHWGCIGIAHFRRRTLYTPPEWTSPDRHRTATWTRRSSRYAQTRRECAERGGAPQPLGLVRADEGRRWSTSSRPREQCSSHRLQRGRRVPQARSFASPCVFIAPPRAWQAVVTCLPLSDKAASAHVAALSHCQRYEPTGNATCPIGRHALGLALRRASALIPKPVLPCCPQKRCTARSQSRSYRLPWTCRPRALACG